MLSKLSFKKPQISELNVSDESSVYEKDETTGRLGRWTSMRMVTLAVEILFSTSPMIFIVIAIIVAYLNGKPISPIGNNIERMIPLSPTIFPILFAALMGRFFRTFALYRAERGVYLGELERLVGCQSLFGAVERQVVLRPWDAMGLLIILVWALSPIGGQAGLRLMSRMPRTIESNSTVRYLPIAAAQDTYFISEDPASGGWQLYAPLFMTTLMNTHNQNSSTMDLWGNVKIPLIESIGSNDHIGSDDWLQIGNASEVSYSSLLGIPVVGVPDGNVTFSMISRYWALDCQAPTYVYNESSPNSDSRYLTTFSMRPSLDGVFIYSSTVDGIASFDLRSFSGSTFEHNEEVSHYSHVQCSVRLRDVESRVFCRDKACRVTSIRPSPIRDNSPYAINAMARNTMWDELPYAAVEVKSHANEGAVTGSTPIEGWLADPDTDFSGLYSYLNLSTVDPRELTARIGIVYNTFWQASIATQYLTGNLPSPLSYYENVPSKIGVEFSFNSSLAAVEGYHGEIYVWHEAPALILIVIACVMLTAGIATLVLNLKTLAPDILGYASTAMRDNTYAPLSRHQEENPLQSHQNGLEQARKLKGVWVRIADVKPDAEVGHIAFTNEKLCSQALSKARAYD
ncbi:hypothetical protein AAFC00_000690 [Neodothiora populina]|uniref:Uncharacterized protein n=1 Tax=Neodothiora populina TaxID=2781224 RepID=A0ABR3PDW6_9PEZI